MSKSDIKNDKYITTLVETTKAIVLAQADFIVDQISIDKPQLKLSWLMCKSLFGIGMQLRQQKALEWVEMIRDNPKSFEEKTLNDESFQDGFVFALEKYLTERNQSKREIFRNIFLGFAFAKDKSVFPLEKFTHTLAQLSQIDIETLREVDISRSGDMNYQIYGNNANRKENIHSLVNLGLLFDTTGSRGGHNPANSPFVRISPFGMSFINYIRDEK